MLILKNVYFNSVNLKKVGYRVCVIGFILFCNRKNV